LICFLIIKLPSDFRKHTFCRCSNVFYAFYWDNLLFYSIHRSISLIRCRVKYGDPEKTAENNIGFVVCESYFFWSMLLYHLIFALWERVHAPIFKTRDNHFIALNPSRLKKLMIFKWIIIFV